MSKRRQHGPDFKARVALEAVRGAKTVNEIAREYEVHPVLIGKWKKELLDHLPEAFGHKPDLDAEKADRQRERLERKVGELTMDIEFLKKKCVQMGIPLDGHP